MIQKKQSSRPESIVSPAATGTLGLLNRQEAGINEEISTLVETLLATEKRLEVLTAGEIDTVAGRGGRTFLLRRGQEQVRDNEAAKQVAILNALPSPVALLNSEGLIVSVNEAWRQFAGADQIAAPGYGVGLNYLEICDSASGDDSAEAQQVARGIRSVLDGAKKSFSTEYACHSPTEQRWLILTVTPLSQYQPNGAVVMHLNITEQKRIKDEFRGLLDAAPDAMVVVNQEGEIVLLNLQAEKQFGYHRDELIGQQVKNIIPEGFAERLITDGTRSAADALAQQIGTGIELIGLRKNGSDFPIEIMLSPLESAEGILVTAAIRDISKRKEMEGRYRGLLEAAPDAMVVVNQKGEIVLLNLQAEKQFGYHRDELVGQQVKNIIPEGFAERIVADGLRSTADALAQQIGTGIELIGLRKNGSDFPIEIMLSPLESAEGILVTAAIRDISKRKEMEGRYRGLLEAAPDAMVVVNQNGEIVLLNVQAEKQFGYSRDELVGQQVKNIIPEGFAERLIADGLRSAEEALAQQIGTGIELIGEHKSGSNFPIEIMLSPLESAEGILVTAAIRDITTRKEAEAHLLQKMRELNRSNEELGQFAYIASHDLQEPLRMVASYTQLLSRRYKGKLDSDADEFIAFAVDGASRMQRLIQDLLTYSRVGTKGKELIDTSSEESLLQAIKNLRGSIEASGALITSDPLPRVLADEMQLTQLFENLVGNAIKYQNAGVPVIHISAHRSDENKWMFSIRDNGLGIDSQYFERIFGMFQRLHKRDEFAGTGIGLAICRKIVERHGGIISVESQVGQGSTFRFPLSAS